MKGNRGDVDDHVWSGDGVVQRRSNSVEKVGGLQPKMCAREAWYPCSSLDMDVPCISCFLHRRAALDATVYHPCPSTRTSWMCTIECKRQWTSNDAASYQRVSSMSRVRMDDESRSTSPCPTDESPTATYLRTDRKKDCDPKNDTFPRDIGFNEDPPLRIVPLFPATLVIVSFSSMQMTVSRRGIGVWPCHRKGLACRS